MNKKLLIQYLLTAVGLLIFGYLAGVPTINGLVTFLSLYITIRFLVDGFKHDKKYIKFYWVLIGYLTLSALFASQTFSFLVSQIENVHVYFIVYFVGVSLLNALPYIWFLLYADTQNLTQKTRCWYFITVPVLSIATYFLYVTLPGVW